MLPLAKNEGHFAALVIFFHTPVIHKLRFFIAPPEVEGCANSELLEQVNRMQRATRRGNSMLEVVAASVIVASTLVPALRMMRDSLGIAREVETCDMMTTLCASRLEQTLSQTCANWNTNTVSGDYASIGYSNIRYTVTKSDSSTDGGLPDRLIAITAVVWDDANGNGAMETNEKRVRFASKIAKFVSYNYEASGA
jgi:hypothetical protein